jgi:hypothetical protein
VIQPEDKLPWLDAVCLVVAQCPYVRQDCVMKAYRCGSRNPLYGMCYTASEAIYHLSEDPLEPYCLRFASWKDATHWYLKHAETGQIIDVTASQFPAVDFYSLYDMGRRRAFLTKEPSKRAGHVLDRIDRNYTYFRRHGPRGPNARFVGTDEWQRITRKRKEQRAES